MGDGLRYEIKDFALAVLNKNYRNNDFTKAEVLAMARVQEQYFDYFDRLSRTTQMG